MAYMPPNEPGQPPPDPLRDAPAPAARPRYNIFVIGGLVIVAAIAAAIYVGAVATDPDNPADAVDPQVSENAPTDQVGEGNDTSGTPPAPQPGATQ